MIVKSLVQELVSLRWAFWPLQSYDIRGLRVITVSLASRLSMLPDMLGSSHERVGGEAAQGSPFGPKRVELSAFSYVIGVLKGSDVCCRKLLDTSECFGQRGGCVGLCSWFGGERWLNSGFELGHLKFILWKINAWHNVSGSQLEVEDTTTSANQNQSKLLLAHWLELSRHTSPFFPGFQTLRRQTPHSSRPPMNVQSSYQQAALRVESPKLL